MSRKCRREPQPASASLKSVLDQLPVVTGNELPVRRPQIRPEWLVAKFGYGRQVARRKRFYAWLCATVSEQPIEFEKMVKSVARSAEQADNPGNYFVAVVMRRGREMGFIRS